MKYPPAFHRSFSLVSISRPSGRGVFVLLHFYSDVFAIGIKHDQTWFAQETRTELWLGPLMLAVHLRRAHPMEED